ncbi:MAG: TIGR00282 family metallophosphoesterase [Candidatus Izemoplasmatales bacterium]|nr:TIGR00282 family metallophosphoesterase [Candidatus Izemoplasmatales bacterium]MDD4069304.1 TIGR00282 family metallophosphoesterase [Candidatus Izemoplasmatales bacterium]MDY0138790.1 TIGR00282 family metallophosphoesterase [Candidatus Izemoplasmatales bacterium]
MKVLFIGDIYMELGQKAFDKYFSEVKNEYKPQFIIVNGENIEKGNGLSKKTYKSYLEQGVNVFTLGNHAFSRSDAKEVLELDYVTRPANYGPGAYGKEWVEYKYNSKTIVVINLLGRIFMHDPTDNPFIKADEILSKVKADYIIVDFHAEATSEKYALAYYLDGRVDAVIGTHTHVPTADNIVLPKGTLYISDVGMTGAKYGIIGGSVEQGIRKFISGVPERVKPENNSCLQFNACLLDLENRKITRINIFE